MQRALAAKSARLDEAEKTQRQFRTLVASLQNEIQVQ